MAERYLEPIKQNFFLTSSFSPCTIDPFEDFYAKSRRKEMLMVLLSIRDKAVFLVLKVIACNFFKPSLCHHGLLQVVDLPHFPSIFC